MNESDKPPEKEQSVPIWKAILGDGGDRNGRSNKYKHYLFVISILVMLVCVLALLNAYFHLINVSSYNINQEGVSSPFMLAGYLGMFVSVWISPVPDYILVPAYGFLSSIGVFNAYTTFLVCLAAALIPIEYGCGRLVPRPLLLRGLSYVRISEKDIETADKWLVEHGRFSIFIATFIPFGYSITALAAGTLKMNAAAFFAASTVGFGLRFIFLEYVGYFSIYIFTASFDYSQMTLFSSLLILSSVYAALYLIGAFRFSRRMLLTS
jgi:membrane protein DedA with SNARE-associated domain